MADTSSIRKFKDAADYTKNFIVQGEIDKYLPGGKHFIDEGLISRCIADIAEKPADPALVREIIAKSESTCETLKPVETAVLRSAAKELRIEFKERGPHLRGGRIGRFVRVQLDDPARLRLFAVDVGREVPDFPCDSHFPAVSPVKSVVRIL